MKKQIGLFFGAVSLAAVFGLFAGLVQHPATVAAQSGSTCSGPYIQTGTGQNCVVGMSLVNTVTTLPDLTTVAVGTLATAATKATAFFEAALGNPGTNGYLLSSTTLGVRSWVALPISATTANVQSAISGHAIAPSTATLTAAAPTVSASQVGIGGTVDAPGANKCPAVGPTGCLVINVGGTLADVPYY